MAARAAKVVFCPGIRRQVDAAGVAPNIPPKSNRRWKPCFSAALRSEGLRQAGFKAELIERVRGRSRMAVLFQEGEKRQKQRVATARFFAPRVVGARYRALMTTLSDGLIGGRESSGLRTRSPRLVPVEGWRPNRAAATSMNERSFCMTPQSGGTAGA
ncbi:hypothetical protein GCM10008179_34190 [Hansschlegelia plantiphila]|uniref:Uncharacterized protein n=1 Tax=Hansschlegelia plantiphila TaxID=374655 RepID=A0A9W6J2T0_9HYPH|nr:hypothetical protein GCM10008179_34190 [Hansschlegelia plantiphila]